MKKIQKIARFFLFLLVPVAVQASPLYWDAGATAGASFGGTGNWDTVSPLWFNGTSDIDWTNVNNDDAYFTGTAGTVTLVTGINAGDLYFTNTTAIGFDITNATGVETLTLGTGVIDTGGTTNIIGALLTGSTPISKYGDGTLILSAANTSLTGPVKIYQGAVETTTKNGLGIAPTITVTNAGAVYFASGSTITNAFAISGAGPDGLGALRDITNNIYIATTNTGVITLETNATIGGNIGMLDIEGGIASVTNANLTLQSSGGTFHISYTATAKALNLHAGSLTLNGGSLNMAATTVTYSNLVLNGGQLSLGYSADTGFGTVPSALNAHNITISNAANVLVSHTYTMNGNRGIYLGPGGALFGENTSSGTLTIGGPISGPGGLLVEADGAGASIKFTGNNTYSGLTTVSASAALVVGNAGASGTLGTSNVLDNGTLTISRSGTMNYAGSIYGTGNLSITSASGATLTLSGPLSETGTLALAGIGTIVFSGSNSYTANSAINCQYFMVNNTNGSGTGTGTVTVGAATTGAYLGGSGIITGPVNVTANNTLQPGNPITGTVGVLTISNALDLKAGSFTTLEMDATVPTNSAVLGMTSITYGGTLTVNLLNGTPSAGQTYRLFQAASYSGSFESGIVLPTLPTGLSWNTNNLYVNGSISVAGQTPVFNPPVLSGSNFILSGTGGVPNGTYSVLATTNLLLSVTNWTVLSTGNPLDGSGNFSYTNAITPGQSQQYFMIRQP